MICGLQYLHSANVIHGNINTCNILIDGNFNINFCNFGSRRNFDLENGHFSKFVANFESQENSLSKENLSQESSDSSKNELTE